MADTIQALDRALELLIYLNKQGREVGITQIASDMGVYKSTVFRTLSTLEARDREVLAGKPAVCAGKERGE